ncbi:MAG: hypothetical protein Ct9H90mP16_07930 [Candidatus Poseidoniales archaeon]|nr:MAG: hypothetical protein Ct9H90mP16_07930 [Candidatus Poseidoniales archaeon]
MNFVDVDSERYCLGCWTKKSNPEHPEIEQIVEKVEAEVESMALPKAYSG